jgi:4-amino-4-deoxy-L-arabinose transferase-like glycosyltransferase
MGRTRPRTRSTWEKTFMAVACLGLPESGREPVALPQPRASLERVKEWQLIVAGMLVRLGFCMLWATLFPLPYYGPVAGDNFFVPGSDGYIQIARTLYLSGEFTIGPGGQPVHNRPPLHPVAMLIFGAWSAQHWYLFWFVGTALFSGAFMAVSLALGKMFGLTPVQNKVVLLMLAFHPYLIFSAKSATFIMEATLLLLLAVFLFLRGLRGRRWFAFLAGLACGLGALTHGSFLLLPAGLGGLALLWRKPLLSRKLITFGLLLLGTALPVLPWTVRNYHQFNRFIPVVTGQGILYWLGDFEFTGRDGYALGAVYKRATGRNPQLAFSGFANPDDDALLWSLARKDMMERPGNTVRRMVLGVYGFWAPWIPSEIKGLICAGLNLPVVLAVVVLLVRNLLQRRLYFHHIVLTCVILYFNLVFAFFLAVISYFVMVLPLLFLLLVCLWASPQRTPPLRPGVALP